MKTPPHQIVGSITLANPLNYYTPTQRARIADAISGVAADILKGQTGYHDSRTFYVGYVEDPETAEAEARPESAREAIAGQPG